MFSALLLTFSLLSATSTATASTITWLKNHQSAVIKLDTPGYPLWLMDKANAPIMHSQAGKYYWETQKLSAILLNVTMSHDNKTLLLNHVPVLPFADSNIPPLIEAYQVPANITNQQIRGVLDAGLLDRKWEGLTLSFRYLALDYDRVITSDPEATTWYAHEPVLQFRVMGLGAHSQSDVLDAEKQKVLHVTLKDTSYTSSADPKRNYEIVKIELKDFDKSYPPYHRIPATEPKQKPCTLWSWKCRDKGLYEEEPAYRFIWRSRFDQFGRIGSLRHFILEKLNVLVDLWHGAGPEMLKGFIILFSFAMLVLAAVKVGQKKWAEKRERKTRALRALSEWDDGLLGEHGQAVFEEKYADGDEEEVPPPLPPRPANRHYYLIDIEGDEQL